MGAYNDDVLFIHIPKCGGTSAKEYMAGLWPGLCWPRDPTWFMRARDGSEVNDADRAASDATQENGLDIGHVPLFEVERLTGRKPESWQRIVAIIRNPYAQQVSQWWFWHTRYAKGDYHQSDMIAGMYPRIHGWLRDDSADFHRWYVATRRLTGEWPTTRDEISPAPRGYFRWWVEVDGVIPENVVILKMEEMGTTLPAALAPFHDGPMPDVPMSNKLGTGWWWKALTAGVVLNKDGTYTGLERARESLALINEKFKWTFEAGYYDRLDIDAR